MSKGLGISEANRLVGVNEGILHNRDRSRLPQLKQKNYISTIATVLYWAINDLIIKADNSLYNEDLVQDLLLWESASSYTTTQLEWFLHNLGDLKASWLKTILSDNLKEIHHKHFPEGSPLSVNSRAFDLWLGAGVNQHILSILSIRAKQWKKDTPSATWEDIRAVLD